MIKIQNEGEFYKNIRMYLNVKSHIYLFTTAESASTRNQRDPGRLVHNCVPRTALYSNHCFVMRMKFFN